MSRILLPLLLSAAAFATAWWAGSTAPASAPFQVRDGDSMVISNAAPPLPAAPLSGLARRASQLKRTENPELRHIAGLLSDPSLVASERYRLANLWAEQDPAGMWAWLNVGGIEKISNYEMSHQIFESWFGKDSEAALTALRSADPKNQATAARGILSHLTGNDESVRLKLVPFLDEVAALCGPYTSFGSAPADTVAKLMTLPPGVGRDMLVERVGSSWLNSDWKSATAWAATLSDPLKSKVISNMANAAFHAQLNPSMADRPNKSQTEAECFEWAKQWFATEAPPEAKRQLSTAFVRKLASTDPAAALDWAQDNLSARPLAQAMGTILSEQAKKDPAAARALVEGLPPGGMKDRVAFEIAGGPSVESVTWLLKETDKDPNYQWSQLASNWAFKDPAAYRNYLESAAGRELPDGLTRGGLSNLLKKDGPGTMDWVVQKQPPAVIAQALQSWTTEDAAAAVDWALDNAPAANRAESIAAVRKSLTYSRIPASERRALQARLENP